MPLSFEKRIVFLGIALCLIGTAGSGATGIVTLKGAVLGQGGGILPGCRVIFSSNTDPRKMIEYPTAASGAFVASLMTGAGYNVRIMAPGYPLQYFDRGMPLENPDGPPPAPIMFNDNDSITIHCTMNPRKLSTDYGYISGTVRDSADAALPQVRIMALAPGKDVTAEVQTDNQGRFVCIVPVQLHLISATSYNYPVQFWGPAGTTSDPVSSGLITVRANDTNYADMRLRNFGQPVTGQPLPMPVSGGISGRATVKSTNQPAAGTVVCAVRADSATPIINALRYNIQNVNTPYSDTVKSDGTYSMINVPRGNYFVFTKSQKFLTQFFIGADSAAAATPVYVDSTMKSNVDFLLRLGGTISGSVTAKDGKPLGMVQVGCNFMKGSYSTQVQTDFSGKFIFTGLPAGTYCLNVQAGTLLTSPASNQCNYVVAESGTLSGIAITVELGGLIRAAFTSPALQDSMRSSGFDIGLFSDSLTNAQGVLYENWTTGAGVNYALGGEIVSSAIPVGKWRYVIRPSKGAYPLNSLSQPYMASRAYSFGNAASFSSQTPITIAGGDTVRLPAVNFAKGFSVFGTISFEGGEKGLASRVTAYIKDARGYVPVSRGYTTSDSSFELPGLIDGQDYFIGIDGSNYSPQFWSPQGSSVKPSNAYRFSTSAFTRLAVRAVKTPQGSMTGPASLSAWWVGDSSGTGSFTLNCNATSGLGLDSLVLLAKDAYGSTLTIAKFPYVSLQPLYSWKNYSPAAESYQMYVFVGKGANANIRSNVLWPPDPFFGRKPSPGGLLVSLVPMRSGLQVNWRIDSTATAGKTDSAVFYRKSSVEAPYTRYSAASGFSGSFWDGALEKTAPGSAVYYKVEVWSSGTAMQSQETKFIVTQALLDKFPKRLRVGQYETYKTIQQAVDAAAEGDIVSVGPGTYQENISLKGKAVSLEGDRQNGAAPIIDGKGDVAVTIPYAPQSMGYNTIGINGFKIVNGLTGIAAYASVSISQCLFVNLLREAVLCSSDSAAAVTAAATDPFAQVWTDRNLWQCTFIGNNRATIALRATSATGRLAADSTAQFQGGMAPGGYIKVNNSIFTQYASSVLPIDVKDYRFKVMVRNCDFWQTSMIASSSSITFEQPEFQLDPQFKDTVNYFLADGSPLSVPADNNAPIGYDSRGFKSGSDNTPKEPEIPPVKNFKAMAAGPHSISMSWSPLSDTVVFSGYIVFRVDGYDSLWAMNAQSQWEPKIAKDSMFKQVDTFRTYATSFLDTTAVAGKPYVYAAAGVSPLGNFGKVDLPGSRPLADYIVKIAPSLKIAGLNAATYGFTKVVLKWRPVAPASSTPLYTLYRISGNEAQTSVAGDSAALRRLVVGVKLGMVSADVVTVGDSFYVDTALVLGANYLYVATVADPVVPFEARPLTCAAVHVDSMAYKEQRPINIIANRWNMIGPWGMGGPLAFDSSFIIYRWDDDKAVDKLYSQYVRLNGMRSQEGYWFKSGRDTMITITESMHRSGVQKRDSLLVKLRKGLTGWNQVSSPLPFSVRPEWLATGAFTAYAWDGDSAQYTDQAVLRPWRGYWIHTDHDTILRIRPSDVSSIENERTMGKRVAQAHWELKVSLFGIGNDPDNYIGVIAPEAAKNKKLAYPKPPQSFDYAQLFIINNPDGKTRNAHKEEKCAKLYKAALAEPAKKIEWMIGISPSTKVARVKVSGISTVPDKVSLFWVSGAIAVNLREFPEIAIQAHEETVYGYIVATADLRDVGMYTKHFELRGCFPNPVRAHATIEFTVPYSWNSDGSKKDGETRDCMLGIYDMAGRCVATVFSGKIGVGDHRLVWQGASDAGHMVAQGAYVVRLSGGDFQKTLKIMRLR
jgi:hypothetical protein